MGGASIPVSVRAVAGERLEVELGGEVVTVDGWARAEPAFPAEVVVNGERLSLSVERLATDDARHAAPARPAPAAVAASTAESPASSAAGTVVRPPMPGKVIEVRVKVGDRVERGQVLLVLEAMKMRNEVTAPSAGRVAELKAAPGANVRAKEELLRLAPD